MKTHRSWWLVLAVVLVVACSSDSEPEGGSRLGGPCTDATSVTRTQLEAGAVLCEHQILVFPIRPGDDAKVSFRVLTPGDVDLCFDDDDAEAHEASLGGTTVAAQAPCRSVSLPAGDHVLGLRHALREAGVRDARPDVLHTRWTAPTRVSRGRLQVTTNGCPKCPLNEPWPELDGPQFYGYAGDYTDAIITGPCNHALPNFCALGGRAASSFDRAKIVLQPDDGNTRYLIGGADSGSVATFRGATITAGSEGLFAFADATGARILGNGPALDFESTNLTGGDLTEYRGGKVTADRCRLDVSMYSWIVARGADGSACTNSTVTVPKGQSLAGMILAGGGSAGDNLFVWPVDEKGILTMPGTSFERATLRNLTIPCPHGGDLRGASFAGATLDTVSLTGCDLTEARFAGARLTNVTAASGTLLIRADLTNVAVDGLNVSEASLSEATLASAPSSAWTGLVARATVARSLHAAGLVTGLDGSGRGADFSRADLATADLSRAQLPRAIFSGAALTTVDFSEASLVGSTFDSAFGSAPDFTRAHLEPSAVSRSSMSAVRFAAPSFKGAFLNGLELTYARVCGADFEGTHLEGADLTGTLLPLVSGAFTQAGGDNFECAAIKDLATNGSSVATTTCPDGNPGPCSGAAWVPAGFVTCPDVPRKKSGFSCATECECAALKCFNGTCG